MSYHVFFSLSSGLKSPLYAPKGELARIIAHVEYVTEKLGLKLEQWQDNPPRWVSTVPADKVDDETLCRVARDHNRWVVDLYRSFGQWSNEPVADGDVITPQDARLFWYGLSEIDVPVSRWTGEYYREEMEVLYEVMRGRPTQGINFDAEPLTVAQAKEIVILFSSFLDADDQRLDVCVGQDELSASDEYVWCEKCGAVYEDDIFGCDPPRMPCKDPDDCPIKRENPEWFECDLCGGSGLLPAEDDPDDPYVLAEDGAHRCRTCKWPAPTHDPNCQDRHPCPECGGTS